MAQLTYEDFLKEPLKLEERLPTIQEFLLALNDFFPRKESDLGYANDEANSYENVKARIYNSSVGKQNISSADINLYLSYYGFSYKNFMKVFSEVLCQSVMVFKKNAHIVELMQMYFRERFLLNDPTYSGLWIKQQPAYEKPFMVCLRQIDKSGDEGEHSLSLTEKDNSKILDNFYHWLDGVTPTIDKLLEFLDAVAKAPRQKFSFSREKLLSMWFWQKCAEKFPYTNISTAEQQKIDQDGVELKRTFELVKMPKMPYSLKDNDERIAKFKTSVSPYWYPYLLLMDFKHLILQRKDKEAMALMGALIPMYFYVGDAGPWEWYSLVLAFCSHYYNALPKDQKDEKKSVRGLFKRIYNLGKLFEIEKLTLDIENKDQEKIVLDRYLRRFDEWKDGMYFYVVNPKKQNPFPKPDYNKVNQKKVNFLNVVDCPQLIFYSQLNEPDIVQELLGKGANVSATTTANESALYWNLKYLDLTTHLYYGRTCMCPPHVSERCPLECNQYAYGSKERPLVGFVNCIWDGGSLKEALNYSYSIFKEEAEKSRKDAYRIFEKLYPCYVDPRGNWPIQAFEKETLGHERILNKAVCSGDISVVSNVIELYKKYRGEDKLDIWMNEISEVQPRTALFWISRLYYYVHVQLPMHEYTVEINPTGEFFEGCDMDAALLAQSWVDAEPYSTKTFFEEKQKAERALSGLDKINNIVQHVQSVCELRYLREKVSEQTLLDMMQLLLVNHANPLTSFDGRSIQRDAECNALYHAIDSGWISGTKKMIESLLAHPDIYGELDLEKYKTYATDWVGVWTKEGFANGVDGLAIAENCKAIASYLESFS